MTCEIVDDRHKSGTWVEDINKPTIVFDAGMGNWSLFFYPIVKTLRTFAKVCLINRDGYLDSDSSTPKDIISVARQMKAILEGNNIHEPIILVGHSLGGLHVRMFQHLFPERVAGLVLLDAAHPMLYEELPQVKSNIRKQIRLVEMLKLMARMRLLKFAKNKIPTFGLPATLHSQYYRVTTRARYYCTYQSEMKYFETNLTLCKTLGGLGDLPLLVVCSPYGLNSPLNENDKLKNFEDKTWLNLQKDLVNLSSLSIFIKSKGDHFLHLTDTAFVTKAIKSFYQIVQSDCSTKQYSYYERSR